MELRKYKCPNCEKEHEKKVYTSESEGVANIFTEHYFKLLWDLKKEKLNQMPIEEFCKELVLTTVYNYHKNKRRIRVEKDSIELSN